MIDRKLVEASSFDGMCGGTPTGRRTAGLATAHKNLTARASGRVSKRCRACSATLVLFQRPRPCAAAEQQNYQTKPIPYKARCFRYLQKVWRSVT